jgi:hypothetical protein
MTMKVINTLMLLATIAAMTLTTGCSKDDGAGELSETMTGLGEDDGVPTGRQYALPDGVEVIGDMKGGYDGEMLTRSPIVKERYATPEQIRLEAEQSKLRAADDFQYLSIGRYVEVTMVLENVTSDEIRFTLPAGLIFICVGGGSQNGFLIKDVEIRIPARTKVYLLINLFCCNHGRSASSSYDEYIFGPVTNNPLLLEIIEAVRNKHLPAYGDDDYSDVSYVLQSIVWEVTEDMVLSEESRLYLSTLPNE